jgi:hypothetical protein
MCERGVSGGALNLSSTSYLDHGCCGDLNLQEKIPTAKPGIEPGTSWLVVKSSDHHVTRLVVSVKVEYGKTAFITQTDKQAKFHKIDFIYTSISK